jgi:hypothetical protein
MLFTALMVLAGSLVRGLLVLFVWLRFTFWGPGGAVWPIHAFSMSGSCFFLLFASALQGWGPATVVGAFFFLFFFGLLLFFWVLCSVEPLHPGVSMHLCYFPSPPRSISVIL